MKTPGLPSISYRPPLLYRHGWWHTVLGNGLPRKSSTSATNNHTIPLRDGDVLILDEDRKPNLNQDSPILLMMHGLSGCSESSYKLGISAKIHNQPIRTVRFNHRGCGPIGRTQSTGIYHSGRALDLVDTAQWMHRKWPGAKIFVAGFSLSANVLLLALGKFFKDIEDLPISGALAACPPANLEACSLALDKPGNLLIDQYYTLRLKREINRRAQYQPHLLPKPGWPRWLRLRQFDEFYTAPMGGFRSRTDYYAKSSAMPHLTEIQVPTLILASQDDPVIPGSIWNNATYSSHVELRMTKFGGHLAYVSDKPNSFGDHRFMEDFVIQWLDNLLQKTP